MLDSGSVGGLLAADDVLLGGAEDPSHHREDAAEADELIRWVLGGVGLVVWGLGWGWWGGGRGVCIGAVFFYAPAFPTSNHRELQAATAAIDINNAPAPQPPAPPAPTPGQAPAPPTAAEAAATAASTAAPVSTSAPTPVAATAKAADAVLSALDDLEQELGLGDLSSSLLASGSGQQAPQGQQAGAAAGAAPVAVAGGLDGLDDDLGEFEDFLEVGAFFLLYVFVLVCMRCDGREGGAWNWVDRVGRSVPARSGAVDG